MRFLRTQDKQKYSLCNLEPTISHLFISEYVGATIISPGHIQWMKHHLQVLTTP